MSRVALTETVLQATSPATFARNAEVFVYARGTTTKADLYTAESAGSKITQPLTTDSGGRAEGPGGVTAWVAPGSYDLKINGQTIPWEAADGVSSGGAELGAAGEAGKALAADDAAISYLIGRKGLDVMLTATGSDQTAAFGTALDAAIAANGILWIVGQVKLEGEVKRIATHGRQNWRIKGFGYNQAVEFGLEGSAILDYNASGPCLHFEGEGAAGRPILEDFAVRPMVDKPAYAQIEFTKLQSANFVLNRIEWLGSSLAPHYVLAGIKTTDTWNGSYNDCNWHYVYGHARIEENQNLNGGNINVNGGTTENCLGGHYVRGALTTNNDLWNGHKWVGGSGSGERQFYERKTSSGPAKEVTELTLATGLETAYFPKNGAVVIWSSAGAEVVHCTTAETPYNSGTGKLKLRDATALDHSGKADIRIFAGTRFGVITGFYTPSMIFNTCHFEQCQNVLLEGSAIFTACEFKGARYDTSSNVRCNYVGGGKGGAGLMYEFLGPSLEASTEAEKTRLVYAMKLSDQGACGVKIETVNTYAIQAELGTEKHRPVEMDSVYLAAYEAEEAKLKVTTQKNGVELNTFDPHKFEITHTFTVADEIKVASGATDYIAPISLGVQSSEKVKLAYARIKIGTGTKAKVKLQKNGEDITGFTAMSATTSWATVDPTDVAITNNDEISLVVESVEGTPKNLSVSMVFKKVVL